ncbi:MAG: hypothetical protein K2H66_04400 [Oscillospiraceae bacterium]|nr:hypothetical protein [Oscillospiraceae bacterium]
MKKQAILISIFTACLLCSANISANAHHDNSVHHIISHGTAPHYNAYDIECYEHHTVDDIITMAKEVGYPEDWIQTGENEWESNSESYTQDDLDTIYHKVEAYKKKQDEEFGKIFPPSTEPSPELPQETVAPQDNRIDSNQFINMTLEEKQNYINSLSDSEREAFLASLSPSERNSIMKQLPTDQKILLMQDYIDTANTMGLNVSVDSITDDNISLTIRNDDGIIINKADVGVIIDETGISHTKPLLFAGVGILTAIAGFGLLYWYSKHTE